MDLSGLQASHSKVCLSMGRTLWSVQILEHNAVKLYSVKVFITEEVISASDDRNCDIYIYFKDFTRYKLINPVHNVPNVGLGHSSSITIASSLGP